MCQNKIHAYTVQSTKMLSPVLIYTIFGIWPNARPHHISCPLALSLFTVYVHVIERTSTSGFVSDRDLNQLRLVYFTQQKSAISQCFNVLFIQKCLSAISV